MFICSFTIQTLEHVSELAAEEHLHICGDKKFHNFLFSRSFKKINYSEVYFIDKFKPLPRQILKLQAPSRSGF